MDIHKCFDQLVRDLVYHLMREAGCPENIVTAYKSYLENLIVHNSVDGHLGEGHKHLCGIPQGCPMSMMVIALCMRPWVLKMKDMDVQPRVLADDLLVVADGPRHAVLAEAALDTTHSMLHAMGARISGLLSSN